MLAMKTNSSNTLRLALARSAKRCGTIYWQFCLTRTYRRPWLTVAFAPMRAPSNSRWHNLLPCLPGGHRTGTFAFALSSKLDAGGYMPRNEAPLRFEDCLEAVWEIGHDAVHTRGDGCAHFFGLVRGPGGYVQVRAMSFLN